jgi:tRNA threonylcarbamoyladenosine biosynthesis protein TsaE
VIAARTKSADDTRELAAAVGALTQAGDTILLIGELGAGKTVFAQGFGRALGVTDPITSPTFTLMHEHAGRLRLLHLDIYRMDRLQEVIDLGLEELLDEGAVALVEWGDAAAPVLPPNFLEVTIAYRDADDERGFSVRSVGPSWSPRLRALADALGRWTEAGAS